jgi:hypothetical protein
MFPQYQQKKSQNWNLNPQKNNGSSFEQFKGKRFYCSRTKKLDRGNCCFNHIVGLPINEKTQQPQPLFDYEKIIVDKIFQISGDKSPKDRHVWVKKATGLGITELILRLMLWLCVRDNRYTNSQMCIVTGPDLEIALGLIQRMKRIFENINIFIQNKETVLEVNGVMIKAFPSNHLETYRGLTSPKFIFLDEGDFFRESNIRNVRDTTERYIAKSNPYIVMVSTPNKPDLLFQQIEQEPEDKTMYHRLFFNWQWGIDKMFTQDEINLQRVSPSFDREYDLKYAGKIGNVFSNIDIETAIQLGEQYEALEINPNNLLLAGVDPAFGSTSKAALCMVEWVKEHDVVRVVESKEWDQSTPSTIAKYMHELHASYPNNLWFYIDGSGRSLINEAKVMFKESIRWDKEKEVKHYSNKIIPINFLTEHRKLLEHTHYLVSKGMVAIPKSYSNLITSLRTAWAQEWNLNKDESVANDHLDALRLSLREIKFAE